MICPFCENNFDPTHVTQRFCNPYCRIKFYHRKENQRKLKGIFIVERNRVYKKPLLRTSQGDIELDFDPKLEPKKLLEIQIKYGIKVGSED
jgi:hypothetical protein